jgi:hypothetical protein
MEYQNKELKVWNHLYVLQVKVTELGVRLGPEACPRKGFLLPAITA